MFSQKIVGAGESTYSSIVRGQLQDYLQVQSTYPYHIIRTNSDANRHESDCLPRSGLVERGRTILVICLHATRKPAPASYPGPIDIPR
jgi:hypothetical protein